MVQKTNNNELEVNKPAYMYYLMSKSGQCSPTSDTLDSGTGSDLETTPNSNNNNNNNAYNLPSAVTQSIRNFGDLTLDGIPNNQQRRIKSHSSNDSYNTDSEESESSLSCDSLNSDEILRLKNGSTTSIIRTSPFACAGLTSSQLKIAADNLLPTEGTVYTSDANNVTKINFLPTSLLRDIRDRSMTITRNNSHANNSNSNKTNNNQSNNITANNDHTDGMKHIDQVYRSNGSKTMNINSQHQNNCDNSSASYTNEPFNLHHRNNNIRNHKIDSLFPHENPFNTIDSLKRVLVNSETKTKTIYENDKYINFHINECTNTSERASEIDTYRRHRDDDTFAGFKDAKATTPIATILSSKGTIRGVKNRVRNGIATFLQMQQTNVKVSTSKMN